MDIFPADEQRQYIKKFVKIYRNCLCATQELLNVSQGNVSNRVPYSTNKMVFPEAFCGKSPTETNYVVVVVVSNINIELITPQASLMER